MMALNIFLTSYMPILEGTNSGALADRFEDITKDSMSFPRLEADVLLKLAFCWGLFCLFKSEGDRRKNSEIQS